MKELSKKKKFSDEFWKAYEVIQNDPLESRKNLFMQTAKQYNEGKISLKVILMMSILCGETESKLWFCETVPLKDRLEQLEEIKQMNLPKKTKNVLARVFLGDITH